MLIHEAEIVLCTGIALLGGPPVPLDGLRIILGVSHLLPHGVFHRAVRLLMFTMMRGRHPVTLTPPSEAVCRLL
jgi:hypothetical protein